MEEEKNYCSVFDKIQQYDINIGKLITDNCLSRVTSKKSFILPYSLDGMTKEKLMAHILHKPFTTEILKKGMSDKERFIVSINGYRYIVKVKENKLFFNDTEMESYMVIGGGEIFKPKGEVKLIPPSPKEEGGMMKKHKMKKGKKKVHKKKMKGGELSSSSESEPEYEGGKKHKGKKKHKGGEEMIAYDDEDEELDGYEIGGKACGGMCGGAHNDFKTIDDYLEELETDNKQSINIRY